MVAQLLTEEEKKRDIIIKNPYSGSSEVKADGFPPISPLFYRLASFRRQVRNILDNGGTPGFRNNHPGGELYDIDNPEVHYDIHSRPPQEPSSPVRVSQSRNIMLGRQPTDPALEQELQDRLTSHGFSRLEDDTTTSADNIPPNTVSILGRLVSDGSSLEGSQSTADSDDDNDSIGRGGIMDDYDTSDGEDDAGYATQDYYNVPRKIMRKPSRRKPSRCNPGRRNPSRRKPSRRKPSRRKPIRRKPSRRKPSRRKPSRRNPSRRKISRRKSNQ